MFAAHYSHDERHLLALKRRFQMIIKYKNEEKKNLAPKEAVENEKEKKEFANSNIKDSY